MFNTIFLPFYHCLPSAVELNVAQRISSRTAGYLEGVFYPNVPATVVNGGIMPHMGSPIDLTEANQALALEAKQLFFDLLANLDIAHGSLDQAATGLRAKFVEESGPGTQGIGQRARLFDISIVRRQENDAAHLWQHAAEAVLFEGGRPLLLVGETVPERIGRNIVLAWNGSTEAARSLMLGAPFLQQADQVSVLTVDGATVSGPSGAQVAAHLRNHGLPVTDERIKRGHWSAGAAILNYAEEKGADLLIKGAFTHSRLRQIIFGGATREIIRESPLPVLLCH